MAGERPAVVPLSRRRLAAAHLVPSGRSLMAGLAVVAAGAGLYVAARTTGMFAIERIEVRGLPPAAAVEVRRALAPLRGRSLVALDAAELQRRLAALPDVRSFSYDRDFPHTLRIAARPELPVAVLRHRANAWLVSARARVLRRVSRGFRPALPRIWASGVAEPSLGATLDDASGARAARVLGLVAVSHFPAAVRAVEPGPDVILRLRSGLELQLGPERDVPLKLAVAGRIVPTLDLHYRYLDLSVPERPVAGGNPQVAG